MFKKQRKRNKECTSFASFTLPPIFFLCVFNISLEMSPRPNLLQPDSLFRLCRKKRLKTLVLYLLYQYLDQNLGFQQ